jgi:AP-3 complex subunit delta-1
LLLLVLRLTSRASDDGSQLYVNVTNFEWYIDILVTVAYLSLAFSVPGSASGTSSTVGSIGHGVAEALLDVAARAPAVRENTVKRMKRLLADYEGFADRQQGQGRNAEPVVQAAAFIVSEYGGASEAEDALDLVLHRLRLQGGNVDGTATLLLAVMKLLARWTLAQSEGWEEGRLAHVRSYLSDVATRLEGLSGDVSQHEACFAPVDMLTIICTGTTACAACALGPERVGRA